MTALAGAEKRERVRSASARSGALSRVSPNSPNLSSPSPLGRSEREARAKWRAEQHEHAGLYVAREFLRSHFDRRGLKRLHGSCLRYYWQYRHSETGETKLCPGS